MKDKTATDNLEFLLHIDTELLKYENNEDIAKKIINKNTVFNNETSYIEDVRGFLSKVANFQEEEDLKIKKINKRKVFSFLNQKTTEEINSLVKVLMVFNQLPPGYFSVAVGTNLKDKKIKV